MRLTHPRRCLPIGALLLIACLLETSRASAIPWPADSGSSISISGASSDLSGAVWNPVSQSLWVVRQNRRLWEYGYDTGSGSFELRQTLTLPSGIGSDIEACAQVDFTLTDEIYTLDEDNGRITRVANVSGSPSIQHVWNLEVTNNGHALTPEQGGSGPEALEFVPDANLIAAGFRFPDGSAFTGSTKGMGGLMFVGHQVAGRLHVFDINPDTSEDFINYGSFRTSTNETAGLHYDRSSGLMYIWHNPSNVNSLEVSTLSSDESVGTVDTLELYDSGMPSGNLEAIAIVGRSLCGEYGSGNSGRALFLTKDSSSPYLQQFDNFPCDCTGAETEANFDECVLRGDLGGGCVCLDSDLDGDVDCNDFTPPISSQCFDPPECGNGDLEDGETCDDGNEVGGDCCSAVCQVEIDGSACDDGFFCTAVDTCSSGVCGGTGVTDCSASGDQCSVGVCNEGTDNCDTQASNEAGTCDDSQFCTTGEVCTAGACGGGGATDCSASGDQCNVGVCNEMTDSCDAQPTNLGSACDDGFFCTIGEACSASGVCDWSMIWGTSQDCSASADDCNAGVCNEASNLCESVHSNEGGACGNGDACTASVCSSGVCAVGPAVDCDDTDPCTNDSCDGATGCVHEPIEGCNVQSVPSASDSGRLVLAMMLVLVGLGFGYWRTHPRVV